MLAAVVIPIYKEKLSVTEEISLQQVRKILSKWPLIFIGPENKNFEYLNGNDKIIRFNIDFFKDIHAYNKLMLDKNFYRAFSEYEYILIYQLDAFVFYDALEDFCKLKYDYIGASWPYQFVFSIDHHFPRVGNGGFSLRKVKSCYYIVDYLADMVSLYLHNKLNEDVFFSHCSLRKDFNVAPINIAYKFSMEFNPQRVIKKNNNMLPFGCHGWPNHNTQFYIKLFSEYNIDIRSILLKDDDDNNKVIIWLYTIALIRLARRINKNQSVSKLLSNTDISTIHVIKDSKTMKILPILEKELLIKQVYLYTRNQYARIANNLNKNELHLLLADQDNVAIQYLKSKGYSYNTHFISFMSECLMYYERIFHNLGK